MTYPAQNSDLTGSAHQIARPRRALWRGVVAMAVMALMLLGATACGSGSSNPSASNTTTAPAGGSDSSGASGSFFQQAVKYAQCMRAQGVTNYPDPDANGGAMPINPPGVDTSSATYKAAVQACKQYSAPEQGGNPNQQAGAQNQQLKFAQCMRKHGITNFPDPSNSGGQQTLPPSIDTNSSAFKAANQACSSLLDAGSSSGG